MRSASRFSLLAAPRTGLAAGLVLTASLIGLLTGCKDEQAKAVPAGPPPAVQVDVVTLHAAPVTLLTELPGRTSAFRTADVRPQVGGVLLKRLFTEGDEVKEGQLLYQIDPASYQASLASAQASLAHARAGVVSAQATVNRYRPLVAANAVSKQDLDNAVATAQQAVADVASSQAAVKTAEINLAYTRVTAPISGRTSRSSVTEGALLTSNQTTSMVTITQLNPIYVDVTQPSTTVLRLKRELASGQMKSTGNNNEVPVKLTLEDASTYDQPGRLQFSEVTVDQGTGSVTLRAIFPNDAGLLLPGMFVRAELEEGVRQNGLLVPQQGITHNEKGDAIALIVDKDGKVESRTLVADRAIGDKWLVTTGLADGDRVIISGLQKTRPGAKVEAHEAAPPGSAPKKQASN